MLKLMSSKEKYLFFDTETTGLPIDRKAPTSQVDNWPRLVQISWIITDNKGEVLKKCNYTIKPNGFSIPEEASNIHGITTEIATETGVSIEPVLQEIEADLQTVSLVIGHNVEYDTKALGAEFIRSGRKDILEGKETFCTMKSTIDFCAIEKDGKLKWPRLQELHNILFGCNFEDAHDAEADITATMKCFFELRKRKIVK